MRRLRRLSIVLVATVAALAGWLAAFAFADLAPPRAPFDFTVKPGTSLRAIARNLAAEGLLPEAHSFWILGRLLGRDTNVKAGTYRIDGPVSAVQLLEKLHRGDVLAAEIAFPEGTTFRQWLDRIRLHRDIRATLDGLSPQAAAAAAGVPEGSAEGWFFPDTYRIVPGGSDVELLKRAHATMKRRLDEAWEARSDRLPLASAYEALILASIIEKEAGVASERPMVASVFVNRLRKAMRLQADPTVIYGMGQAFDGNIRKKDLLTDTPWNTYTRDGLPPTPIAMPGAASLKAATQPAESDFLYFVGKGDGTHQFSRTLEEHNRAVARYQLGK